jgi:hypothetical protein
MDRAETGLAERVRELVEGINGAQTAGAMGRCGREDALGFGSWGLAEPRDDRAASADDAGDAGRDGGCG